MENLAVNKNFWYGKKVLITGHTGFKGSWLSLWLQNMGANIIGVSLDPPTEPSLYKQANIAKGIKDIREDINDIKAIKYIFQQNKPEVVFHLAAQSLVRRSYLDPIETYKTNVMGSLHILEGVRSIDTVRAVIMITTDKCYENREWEWGYRENDPMGGFDPYSSSKGSAELLIASYRSSYYPESLFKEHKTAIVSVRAGNVIGGGDWAEDRLVPDIIRAFQENDTVKIRNPDAIRPWQHVLEPLSGYIKIAELLINNEDARPVRWIVEKMAKEWGNDPKWIIDENNFFHEANYLKLDCSKAYSKLNWRPKWNLEQALLKIIEWHKLERKGKNCNEICLSQIREYKA